MRVPPAILVVATVVAIGALVYVTGSGSGSSAVAPQLRVARRPDLARLVGRLPGSGRLGIGPTPR